MGTRVLVGRTGRPGGFGAGMAKKRERAPGGSYARLTRAERNSIEKTPDRGESCREIARELGEPPSIVSGEVARHRPRSASGETTKQTLLVAFDPFG